MEEDNEEESFVWNEETEDPLRTDTNDFANSSKVIVKKEPGCSELVNRIIKTEPNTDYQDQTFQPSCSSASQIQDRLSNECEDVNDQDLPVRVFPCVSCRKPYRMVCGSTLMIRGFCKTCLYSSNKGQPNCDYDKSSEHVYSKCLVCNEKFSDVKKLNVHLKFINKCELCDKKFCNANEFEEHLLIHNNLHEKKVNVSSVKEPHCSNGIEAVEKDVKLFINTISDDWVQKDDLIDEGISRKVPANPKKEKPCKKLSTKINKDPASDKNIKYKSRCLLCGKLIPKQFLEDHMDKEHSSRFRQTDQSSKSFLFESSKEEVKSDSSCNLSLQRSGGKKKPLPSRKSENVENVTELNSPADSSSMLNLDKNEVKLSFCKYEYVCELCKVQYDDLNVLKEHIASDQHVNMIATIVGISLSCKLCKGSFSSISDLKSHLIKDLHVINYHIKKSEVSMFCCKICNKTFISESDFLTHELLEGHQAVDKKNDNDSSDDKTTCPVTQENVAASLDMKEKDNDCINKLKDVAVCPEKQEKVVRKPIKRSAERLSRTCKTCNKVFTVVRSLKTHVKSFKHEPYIEFDNVKPSRNSKVDVAKLPQEDKNDEKSVKKNLKNEIVDHHECIKCNKVYSSYYSLKKHSRKCYRNNRKSNVIKLDPSRASVSNENGKSNKVDVKVYDCKVCGKSYEIKSSLNRHIKTWNHYDSGNSSQSDRLELNPPEEKFKPEVLFSCKECHTTFDNEVSLKKHCTLLNHDSGFVKVERKTDLYTCKICKLKCNCLGDLLYHYCCERHNLHCKVRVNCVCCHKTFKKLDLYVRHATRKQHVEESLKTYTDSDYCKLCCIKYRDLHALKTHIISNHHIGTYLKHLFDKKKKCTVKSTSSAAASTNKTNNVSFNVNNTNKTINSNVTSVISSNRIHKCKYCNKLFNYHFQLTRHVKIHENGIIKPSKCIGCHKRFSNIVLMKRHYKSCHSEKIHACPICNKKFCFPYQVNLHIRVHYRNGELS